LIRESFHLSDGVNHRLTVTCGTGSVRMTIKTASGRTNMIEIEPTVAAEISVALEAAAAEAFCLLDHADKVRAWKDGGRVGNRPSRDSGPREKSVRAASDCAPRPTAVRNIRRGRE